MRVAEGSPDYGINIGKSGKRMTLFLLDPDSGSFLHFGSKYRSEGEERVT